mmetsp:Transcript_27047/g.52715  ORF Transcript_27047/g.52715 Transcript_27047/m.52715 type:complete len:232 (-) Transcript_27047:16-711(-)
MPCVLLALQLPNLPAIHRNSVEGILDIARRLVRNHPPHGAHRPCYHPRVRPQRRRLRCCRLASLLDLVHGSLRLPRELSNCLHARFLKLECLLQHAPLRRKRLRHRLALHLYGAPECLARVDECFKLPIDHLVVGRKRRCELWLADDDRPRGDSPPPALHCRGHCALCRRHVANLGWRSGLVPVGRRLHGILHVRHRHSRHKVLISSPLHETRVERHGLPAASRQAQNSSL